MAKKLVGSGMIKTKFVFAVSFVAMMAVGAAHAEIAGVSYVEEQVGVATTAANNAQTSANNANTAAGKAQTSADNAQDAADAAQESADAAAASAKTANDAVALKQDALGYTAENAANRWTSTENYNTVLEDATKYPNMPVVNQMISDSAADATAQINSVNSKVTALTTTVTNNKSATDSAISALEKDMQETISDLATIRSGASAGATALQKADIVSGSENGTISVDGTNVAVKGLGTAAYTASTAYATAAQGTLAASAVQPADLADVATSGSYKDLSDTPTIPTVNNATLTIQKNGTNVATFTANSGTAATANITVPTKVSELTNDSNYATTAAVNAKVTTAQGSAAASKAVITDASGNITTGTITSGMITDATIKDADIANDAAIAQSKISGLTTALAGKLDKTAKAASATTADSATKAMQDASGNVITTTYEKAANKVSSVSSYNEDIDSTTKFPTMAVAQDMASQAAASASASKLNKNLGTSAASKAVITDASGNITTGTITSGMITDATIKEADIAAGAVTAAKTTGIYGFIPSGGEGASTTAAIWVE